jgi:hypothetical protein
MNPATLHRIQADAHADENPGHDTNADELGWGCSWCTPFLYDEIRAETPLPDPTPREDTL